MQALKIETRLRYCKANGTVQFSRSHIICGDLRATALAHSQFDSYAADLFFERPVVEWLQNGQLGSKFGKPW